MQLAVLGTTSYSNETEKVGCTSISKIDEAHRLHAGTRVGFADDTPWRLPRGSETAQGELKYASIGGYDISRQGNLKVHACTASGAMRRGLPTNNHSRR